MFSTATIIDEKYCAPTTRIQLQGYAMNVTQKPDGGVTFKLLLGNTILIDNVESEFIIKETDIITVVNRQSAFNIPIVYPQRRWVEIYKNEDYNIEPELISTNITHTRFYIVIGIWGLTISLPLIISLKKNWKCRTKHKP